MVTFRPLTVNRWLTSQETWKRGDLGVWKQKILLASLFFVCLCLQQPLWNGSLYKSCQCFQSIPFCIQDLRAGRFPSIFLGSPGFPVFLSPAAEYFAAPEQRVGDHHWCFIQVTVLSPCRSCCSLWQLFAVPVSPGVLLYYGNSVRSVLDASLK